MYNIAIDEGNTRCLSKNFEDFDSIRSVLLYRSVGLHAPKCAVQTVYFHDVMNNVCAFCLYPVCCQIKITYIMTSSMGRTMARERLILRHIPSGI